MKTLSTKKMINSCLITYKVHNSIRVHWDKQFLTIHKNLASLRENSNKCLILKDFLTFGLNVKHQISPNVVRRLAMIHASIKPTRIVDLILELKQASQHNVIFIRKISCSFVRTSIGLCVNSACISILESIKIIKYVT